VRFFSPAYSKFFSGIFQNFLRHIPNFSPARSKIPPGTFKNSCGASGKSSRAPFCAEKCTFYNEKTLFKDGKTLLLQQKKHRFAPKDAIYGAKRRSIAMHKSTVCNRNARI